MAHTTVILDTRKKKKNGKFPLKIRVTHQGEFYISLNIDIDLSQWRSDTSRVVGHSMANQYNQLINIRKLEIEQTIVALCLSKALDNMSVNELKKHLSTHAKEEVVAELLLVTHCEKYISRLNRPNSIASIRYTMKTIQLFDASQLTFRAINYDWLRRFEGFMNMAKMSINTRAIHFRNIKAVYNDAINCDQIGLELYPFRKFKIKKEATKKRALTISELRRFINYDFGTDNKYRDFFALLFSLIGINTIDIAGLCSIDKGRIRYRRAKTGKLYDIEVHEIAMKIIERYKGTKTLLSFYENKTTYRNFSLKTNNRLKIMCRLLNTETEAFPIISTYWSRHTWATIAASLEIPKETIAAALGHGGSSVTDIYIDFDQKKVDEANRRVIDFVFNN